MADAFGFIVDDASPYTVFVQLEDQEVQASSEGTDPVSFDLRRDDLGRTNLVFTVVDDLGNVATKVRNITTQQAIADTEVALEVLEPFPLPAEPVTFRLTVSQDGGVTTIPVAALVTLPGVGTLYDQSLDVARGGHYVEALVIGDVVGRDQGREFAVGEALLRDDRLRGLGRGRDGEREGEQERAEGCIPTAYTQPLPCFRSPRHSPLPICLIGDSRSQRRITA